MKKPSISPVSSRTRKTTITDERRSSLSPVAEYSILEHRHRFSAWAAGRAASVVGQRFTVEIAARVITESGLRTYLDKPSALPDAATVDDWHRQCRGTAINCAKKLGLSITHGVAAKLINVYFKAGLVCSGVGPEDRIGLLHPPIDSVLLEELSRQKLGTHPTFWKTQVWSKLDSSAYESVICAIRELVGERPMWTIEEHWRGFR